MLLAGDAFTLFYLSPDIYIYIYICVTHITSVLYSVIYNGAESNKSSHVMGLTICQLLILSPSLLVLPNRKEKTFFLLLLVSEEEHLLKTKFTPNHIQ